MRQYRLTAISVLAGGMLVVLPILSVLFGDDDPRGPLRPEENDDRVVVIPSGPCL